MVGKSVFPCHGMTFQRYWDLQHDVSFELTDEELQNGWLFDHDNWDGMLIHKSWPEANV